MVVDIGGPVVVGTAVTAVVGLTAATYALHERRSGADDEPSDYDALANQIAGADHVALLVPDAPPVDAIAAAVGLAAVVTARGATASIATTGRLTGEDTRTFCTLFDIDVRCPEDHPADADVAVAVGGSGSVPSFGTTPVVAAVRHRAGPTDDQVVISGDDGSTSTTVARLLRQADVTPEARTATALLYGVRAGTHEFRRARGTSDYEAASFLHEYAESGRLDALRAPGLSDETFDVLGTAIANRERRATFAVANAGSVPSVSALEDATDTLLRLEGVTCTAAFGVTDDTVVASCRTDDVRQSASDLLAEAFRTDDVAGNADVATARVDLGLFARVSEENRGTLDELVDASARRALFSAFEAS